MSNSESSKSSTTNTAAFHIGVDDRNRLESLPWQVAIEEWPEHGVIPLIIRRGESRHPVIFVELEGIRYAIKETTPFMAEREIRNLREIARRGIPSLNPIGTVTVKAPPLLLGTQGPGGLPQYTSGDRGYTVTSLAPRVVPHVLLYRLPFTRRTKRHLLSAAAVLLVELHEHGVYWGDPSLANILMRIDGRRILAILADAETVELFSGPVSDELREQDIALFSESLLWQAEDLRQAQGKAEDEEVVDDKDVRYFIRRYRWLRQEHARLAASPSFTTLYQVERLLDNFNNLGFSLLDMGGRALQEFTTVLPGWYARRIHELLGINVPRRYARRFYNTILGHQVLMSQHEGHTVSIEEAAKDWYTRYHLPAVLLLRQHLTSGQDPMDAYFSIMDHNWKLSKKAGHEIPLDEAVVDWALHQAKTDKLGAVDPATIASWWHERQPVTQALEPPLIESKQLEPLLAEKEQPLVHLSPPELEQHLNGILEDQQSGEA